MLTAHVLCEAFELHLNGVRALLEDPGDGSRGFSFGLSSKRLLVIHVTALGSGMRRRSGRRSGTSVCPMLFCKGSRVQQREWTPSCFRRRRTNRAFGDYSQQPKWKAVRSWPILVRVHFPQSKRLPPEGPQCS